VAARTLLSVRNLSKSFGAVRIADDISFDVRQGEILGVIGPNGAGKTTLFGLLAGNIPPSGGRIDYQGEEITPLPPDRRARLGIARTYQVPRPFSHMTVSENLMTAARFGGGMNQDDAATWVDQVLSTVGMQGEAAMLAGRLPLLLRKRHELARALAMKPKLLLVDEVAAGLTDQEVNEFIAMVMRIRDSGATIVWIEHVMKTMLTATDRLIALAGGKLLASGPAREVIDHPEVRRVYLGA
jgi:branched-chain amino acid transport system ATP-binding protein